MSTLRYADQAKSIVNTVKVNEDPFARTVRRLKDEASDNTEKSAKWVDVEYSWADGT